MDKRPVDDGSEEKEPKKVKKLTPAQQAKQARIEQEKKEREERWARERRAKNVASRFSFCGPKDGVPDTLAAAINEIPLVSRVYLENKQRAVNFRWGGGSAYVEDVKTQWNWKTDSWSLPLTAKEDTVIGAVIAFSSDAPGVRAGVAKLQELEATVKRHVECVTPTDLFYVGMYEDAPWFDRSELFAFVCEKHPEFKGTANEPLSAADYDIPTLVSAARRIIVDAHKHYVATEPARLPPVFQKALERKKALEAEAEKKKSKGKGRR